MKTQMIVATIVLLVFLTACATLTLTPKDRALLRDFDEVTFSADDIRIMEDRGLDLQHLTAQQKLQIIKDWNGLQAALLY